MSNHQNCSQQKLKDHILRILFFAILSCCFIFFFTDPEKQPIIKSIVDGDFHVSRLLSLQNIWQSPVNFNYFNHIGEVVNSMYPWATLYPMFLIFKITNNIISAYYIYFWILTFITLELTYWCVEKMKQPSSAAIISAVLYTFSMPRSSDIYYRMAVGEAIALTFFPLVVLGIYQIFYEDHPKWITLTLGMTLLVYSHVLSLVIASGVVVLFFVLNLVRKKINKVRLIALIKATITTFLLGIGFFIPMLQMMFSVYMNKPMIYNLFQEALKPGDLLIKSLNNNMAAILTFNAVYIIVIFLLFINFKKIKGFFRDSLLMGSLITILSTSIFPWDLFQNIFKTIQFPWRLIGIAGLFLAISFAPIIQDYARNHSKKHTEKLWLLALSGILLCHFGTLDSFGSMNGWGNGNTQEVFLNEFKNNIPLNALADYAPKALGADIANVRDQKLFTNETWKTTKSKLTSNKVTYTYDSPNATTAFIPICYYPGEIVEHNGNQIKAQSAANGTTLVHLNKGKNVINISFEYTKLARISWMISILSFIILLCWIGYQRFKRI